MKYALIGCGRISHKHIGAALNNGLEIVALCDIVPEKAERQIRDFGLNDVKIYTDYKDMLKTEKPQLVAVATESGKHASIALDCIEAGCNVIIEKPIALSLEDADRIINAGKRKGVRVCVNHQKRFNKAVRCMHKAIEDGRFGKLFHGNASTLWSRDGDYYGEATWRGTWAQDGGALMNQCIHNIDLLIWMMGGEPTEVFAFTDRLNHPYIEAEDLGVALIKFKNGSYGIIEGTTNIPEDNLEETLSVFGENGVAKLGGSSDNTIEEWRFTDGIDDADKVKKIYSDDLSNVYGLGHTPLYTDVIEAIENGREPSVTAEDGKKALETVLAIYKSSKEHKPVMLPLCDCSSVDFAGMFD